MASIINFIPFPDVLQGRLLDLSRLARDKNFKNYDFDSLTIKAFSFLFQSAGTFAVIIFQKAGETFLSHFCIVFKTFSTSLNQILKKSWKYYETVTFQLRYEF